MGKRVSIYMPDEILKSIQKSAKEDSRSVSNYLVQLYKNTLRNETIIDEILPGDSYPGKVIIVDKEKKWNGFIEESGEISKEVYEKIKPMDRTVNIIATQRTVPDIKEFGRGIKVDKNFKEINPVKDKIKKVVKEIPGVQPANVFNPQPKKGK